SANRSNLAAKFVRKLNSKVPQTADALHRNKTTRRRAAVSQGVKGRDSGTKQRRCFGVAQRVGYFRQCVDGSDHVLLIAPVVADTRNFGVAAVKVASTPAFETRVVLPAMPADANALSPLPSGDLGAQLIDDACHLVPRHPRILDSRPEAFFHENVTVANTTGLHSNAHLSRTRFGNLALNYFETCSRLRNLCHLHRSYCDSCCHESSFEFVRYCRKTVSGETIDIAQMMEETDRSHIKDIKFEDWHPQGVRWVATNKYATDRSL